MLKKIFFTLFLLQLVTPSFADSSTRQKLSKPLTFLPRSTNTLKRGEYSLNKSLISPNSTVIFEENFEGTIFPPSGWKTVNSDGGGTTGPWFKGNTSVFTAYSGDGYAAANYQGANDFLIDEWLITPLLTGINSTDTLSFWHRSPDYSAWDDSIEIRISTTDTNLGSFNKLVDYFKTSTNGWAQKKYPLKNYIPDGSNIYIAFRYLIYDGGISGLNSDYVGIDLVQVIRPQLQYDVRISSLDYPINNSKLLLGSSFEATARVQNNGTSTVNNIPVRLKIFSPSGTVFEDNSSITSLNPNQEQMVIFSDYTASVPGRYTLQIFTLLSSDQNRFNDTIQISFTTANLYSGLYTVGYGGRFLTIKEAIDTLSANIISDNVTLSLISLEYNESPILIGSQSYLTNEKFITIKPATGISPTININSTPEQPYGISIFGASKIIIDGSNSTYQNRNLRINIKGINGKKGIFIGGSAYSNADSNTVKNVILTTGADSLSNALDYIGIFLSGLNYSYRDAGNTISNCEITKFGSIGIATKWEEGLIIEKNNIENWNQYYGENDVYGIFLDEGTTNAIIRKNKIGNLKNYTNYYWSYGIEINSGSGSNNLICNNMIYNILSLGPGNYPNLSRAIYSSNLMNEGDKIYYNSIYLSGNDPSTSNQSRIVGIELIGGTNIQLLNNNIVNEATLSTTDAKAYCIYLLSLPYNFQSNYNNLYAPTSSGIIGFYQANRRTLTEWINAFNPKQDSASLNVNPHFISPSNGDLHIQINSNSQLDNAGIPISIVPDDFDNNLRNSINPDIGADEFITANKIIFVDYYKNWNLVSIPLLVADYRKSVLFPFASSDAYSFNSGYISNTLLSNGIGYWIKFPESYQHIFGGDSLEYINITLTKGWNLIGSSSNTISIQIKPPFESAVFGYKNGYIIVDSLHPGKAYWVKVSKDTIINLNELQYDQIHTSYHKKLKMFNSLKIFDNDGNEQTLFFGESNSEVKTPLELPPSSPNTNFDVRFLTNNILEIINPASSIQYLPEIKIQTDQPAVNVEWSIIDDKFDYELVMFGPNKSKEIKISNQGYCRISKDLNFITIKVSSKKLETPTEYKLLQNYPNPFNSTTTISFQLPEKSYVKLTIFDLLGQELYTLVDQKLESGYHQFKIDNTISKSFTSGIYFCKFFAKSEKSGFTFNDIIKLVLIK